MRLNSLAIWSSNFASRYLPNGVKMYVHSTTYTSSVIAVLFKIAKNWKNYRCTSIGRCIDKQTVGHSYNILLFKTWISWRNLKGISLNERSQSEKASHYMVPTIWCFGRLNTETIKRAAWRQSMISWMLVYNMQYRMILPSHTVLSSSCAVPEPLAGHSSTYQAICFWVTGHMERSVNSM